MGFDIVLHSPAVGAVISRPEIADKETFPSLSAVSAIVEQHAEGLLLAGAEMFEWLTR
jgi:hypothetical protein